MLTTAQQVRLRIQDQARLADTTRVGDGTATRFTLPHANLTTATAYVPAGGPSWSATGCTFNSSGYVEFSGVISANSAWRVTYVYSVFSDDEIGYFTAVGGSVPGAALQACRTLQFDSLKRARWISPDGTQYDDTMAQMMLIRMESALRMELERDNLGVNIYGWSEEQANY